MKKLNIRFTHDEMKAVQISLMWEVAQTGNGLYEKMRGALLAEILYKVQQRLIFVNAKYSLSLSAPQCFALMNSDFSHVGIYETVVMDTLKHDVGKKMP